MPHCCYTSEHPSLHPADDLLSVISTVNILRAREFVDEEEVTAGMVATVPYNIQYTVRYTCVMMCRVLKFPVEPTHVYRRKKKFMNITGMELNIRFLMIPIPAQKI